jgi:hypothetical protein
MAVIVASGETNRKLCASHATSYLDSRDVTPNSSSLTPHHGQRGGLSWNRPRGPVLSPGTLEPRSAEPRGPEDLGLLRSGRLP